MSRQLPERPSLDHLKKQAKVLLRELKRRDPGARLTAAQHALALEYGFASWRDLRAHVQKLADEDGENHENREVSSAADENHLVSSAALPFDRYTPTAKLALFFSRDEASQVGSGSIDPEHVLLGSIRAGRSATARFFEHAHVSIAAARAEIARPRRGAEPIPYSVEIPFSGTTRQVLLAATGEADRLGHQTIAIAHLLLGMLDRHGTLASSLLTGWGITAQRIRADISDLLDECETGS
jgi:hypothetical protein